VKLYQIKREYTYGEDRETKRQAQTALVASLGLREVEESHVFCGADEALALIAGGYCGTYFSVSEHAKPAVYETRAEFDVQSLIATSIEKSIAEVGKLFNTKTSSEQPNMSLMDISETMLVENSCTDDLQSHLSMGWRILAICPQPQRRPDYVLGRPRMSALRG
jgi:hypothetical protein